MTSMLKRLNVQKLQFGDTGLTYEQVLRSEALRLKRLIQKNIDKFYASYTPKVYERRDASSNMGSSIVVDDIANIKIEGKMIKTYIKYNSNVMAKSYFSSGSANVLLLMNYGYRVNEDVWFKNIEYFGYRKGAYFLEDAIAEFNRTSKYGVIASNPIIPDKWYGL